MDLNTLHIIDGKSLWGVFGILVESGTDDFLKFPARKPSETHDWGDSNGIDIDTSRVFFEAKPITLRCNLIASDEADFWAKRNGFFAEWKKPGPRSWRVNELSQSFNVIYKDCSDFDRFTRIKVEGVNKVMCKFTLNLIEVNPDSSGQGTSDVFIVDEAGRFLVT